MSDESSDNKQAIRNILGEAVDITEGKFTYVNSVQLYFSANDVVLDMYFISPSPTPNAPAPMAQRLHRIVLPHRIAAEVAELLTKGIATLENELGINFSSEPENALGQQELPLQKDNTDE